MVNVALLTPGFFLGDAVGNDIVGMHRALTQQGHNCCVFSLVWDPNFADVQHVQHLSQFLQSPEDIVIYHCSIGWDEGLALLQSLSCKKVVKYHNITPAHFYKDYSEVFTGACAHGRQQLSLIAQLGADLYLSDSVYNAEELIELGVPTARSHVVPPFHQIDRLQFVQADLSVLEHYQDGCINWLMVGRVVPNKGHLHLLKAFEIYHRYYNPHSRLLIVGKWDDRLESYVNELHGLVRLQQLSESVIFVGGVTDEMLKAYYLVAHAFTIMSEHEGFCVPLIESMALRVPVVAYGSTAIPQTAGGAGLIWPELDPALMAGSLDYLVQHPATAQQLAQLGWERYQAHFTNPQIEKMFMQGMKELWA